MIDLLLLAILAIITWCVSSEGAWGAGIMLVIVVLSALLAMNFFEPLAGVLQAGAAPGSMWSLRVDVIALIGLFILFVSLLRAGSEKLCPTFLQINGLAYEIARWSCSALTGYVTIAFLLTALHTAPLPREFMGFAPELGRRTGPLVRMAPDFQWLGFTQYVSEKVLRGRVIFDGPQFTVGEIDNKVWPTFPIRYASRRGSIGTAPTTGPGSPGGGMKRIKKSSGGGGGF